MGKLKSHYVIFDVYDIAKLHSDGGKIVRLYADVKKSNLLPCQMVALPFEERTIKNVSIDDTVRLTFFAKEDETLEEDAYMSAIISGMRIEVWNELNSGWDKAFEKFLKDGESWENGF